MDFYVLIFSFLLLPEAIISMFSIILSEIGRARVVFFSKAFWELAELSNHLWKPLFFPVLSFLFALTNCYWNTKSWYRLSEITFHLSNAATAQSLANAQTGSWFISKHNWTHFWWPDFPSMTLTFSMQVNYHGHICTADKVQSKICLEKAAQWWYWLVWIWFSLAERGGFSHRLYLSPCISEIILWRKNWRLTQYLEQRTHWSKPPFKVFITVSSDELPPQNEIAHTCS